MKELTCVFFCVLLFCGTSCLNKKQSNKDPKIVITEEEPTRNKDLKITEVKNLVFRGGGVLGVVYAGALNVLEQQGQMAKLEGVAGTSAGSIMAALVAMKYPISEAKNPNTPSIESLVDDLPFKKFKDDKNDLGILGRYGLYSGNYFLKWMKKQVAASPLGLSEMATFRDLKEKGGLDLRVYSSNINKHELQEFSFSSTPDIPIAEAVRASMSIPLFFKAWQFSDKRMGEDFFVDGGVINGYPINAFDSKEGVNPGTLGLYQGTKEGKVVNEKFGHHQIIQYVKNTFLTLMQTQHTKLLEEKEDLERTVFINVFGISPINFDITTAQQDSLKKSGVLATEMYLKQNGLMKKN